MSPQRYPPGSAAGCSLSNRMSEIIVDQPWARRRSRNAVSIDSRIQHVSLHPQHVISSSSDTDALGRFVLFPGAVGITPLCRLGRRITQGRLERLSKLNETDERVGARQLAGRLSRLGNILGEPVQVAADGCRFDPNKRLYQRRLGTGISGARMTDGNDG